MLTRQCTCDSGAARLVQALRPAARPRLHLQHKQQHSPVRRCQSGLDDGGGKHFTASKDSDQLATALALSLASIAGPAQAADVVYNNAGGSQAIRNIFGTLYVILLAIFAGRLFIKRANRGKSQRIGAPAKRKVRAAELLDEATDQLTPTSPISALGGALQAGVLCFLLYLLSTSLDGFFDKQQVPGNFTARNITLTVQTIVRAVSYLFTFICGVNTVGLTGLTIQLLLFPEKPKDFGN